MRPPRTIWGEDAGDEAEDRKGQVAPAGNPDERAEGGGDDGDAHDAGEQAVELLDPACRDETSMNFGAAARRPGRAPETRTR